MPYQINRYSGTPLVTVDEGTLNNQATTLRLVGKNYAGYGDIQNENFVYLTENFANTAPPPNALSGQIWYDSEHRKLKFWDALHWRTTGGAEIGPTAPVGLTTGDFWWNTDTQQLYAYDGVANFVLVGPQAVPGAGATEWLSIILVDDQNNRHAVMEGLVDGRVLFIISKDTFTLNATINPIVGFSYIKQGMTMIDSAPNGVTSTGYRLFGTATDSDRLGGHLANEYVFSLNAVFHGTASFDNSGFTVGNNGDLAVFVNNTVPTIQNLQSNNIQFKVKDGLNTDLTMQIKGGAVDPGITDTYDLGEPLLRWRNIYCRDIYADNFHGGNFLGNVTGIADKARTLYFDLANGTPANPTDPTKYVPSTALATNNTIVARDNSGNFAANIINATATQSLYADLAERYEADASYEPGTVVVFGGDKEITVTTVLGDHRVAGVVSTNPAYTMNVSSDTEGFLPVALRGKVPVKVIGKVLKGDILVSSNTEGYAVSASNGDGIPASAILAKALVNKDDDSPGVVMAVIV